MTQSNPGGRRQTGAPGETLRCGAPRAEPRVCALAPLREGEGTRATRANALGSEHVALSREEDTSVRGGCLSFSKTGLWHNEIKRERPSIEQVNRHSESYQNDVSL